jgi:Protein of unknown function (DUF2800).
MNYDEEKLAARFATAEAARRGVALHAFAHNAIVLRQKLQGQGTVAKYVNDAIGFGMSPEQMLVYSENAYGTADCISFNRNKLRIHDLKTGVTPASEHQLEVYAALFCLEYGFKPFDIDMDLRLYQTDEVKIFDEVDPGLIAHIMDKIITFDKLLKRWRLEVAA